VLRSAQGDRSRFAILRQGRQGQILALNERALGEARSAVRRSHWGEVAFAEPGVRTRLDPGGRRALEPIMRVKVSALREHLDAVRQVLGARGARMLRAQRQGRYVCVQSEARLASLLGFEEEIRCVSAGSAQVACRLECYRAADAA
jgi:translation elongation factor EF-G